MEMAEFPAFRKKVRKTWDERAPFLEENLQITSFKKIYTPYWEISVHSSTFTIINEFRRNKRIYAGNSTISITRLDFFEKKQQKFCEWMFSLTHI